MLLKPFSSDVRSLSENAWHSGHQLAPNQSSRIFGTSDELDVAAASVMTQARRIAVMRAQGVCKTPFFGENPDLS
jgi:hypothetical protein